MKLTAPTTDQLYEMMSWFKTEPELRNWTGPNFRYPLELNAFTQDLNLERLITFSLISTDSTFIAFGQCYDRLNRCHLARLVVSPNHRGKGIIFRLVDLLSEYGMKEFDLNKCSLFVTNRNKTAINAYIKYGFTKTQYPEAMPIKNCIYMVK